MMTAGRLGWQGIHCWPWRQETWGSKTICCDFVSKIQMDLKLNAFCAYQGYDDIPEEIADPDAKKVCFFHLTFWSNLCGLLLVNSWLRWAKISARRLGWWGRWWVDSPNYSKPWVQGSMEGKGLWTSIFNALFHANKEPLFHKNVFPLIENQEPQLQREVEGTFDWQPRFLYFLLWSPSTFYPSSVNP